MAFSNECLIPHAAFLEMKEEMKAALKDMKQQQHDDLDLFDNCPARSCSFISSSSSYYSAADDAFETKDCIELLGGVSRLHGGRRASFSITSTISGISSDGSDKDEPLFLNSLEEDTASTFIGGSYDATSASSDLDDLSAAGANSVKGKESGYLKFLHTLEGGWTCLKQGRNGKLQQRKLYISNDQKEIRWRSHAKKKSFCISNLQKVDYSPIFSPELDSKEKERCFSLIFNDRKVIFVCQTVEEKYEMADGFAFCRRKNDWVMMSQIHPMSY
mmetsp:Transcript_980/g.1438  ORF Transcript_980/g.1438 Transcript_980/m.1438 type:complete len:273 (-) Transcript_980:97-915(-)|eukprot:CAMPEP_0194573528 /NCGR_PEP_ID=MMETSP0292-20121207/9708_1 /TAXON_ID=39354 /ORGANISM="Heterosigma akashiwo, Strain CCMP2393" /LENGTH=272 /DNA_ID=CAMNT_0039424797 /DNA_START=207 /DNA_END=1025 /DNA_ORIENTATION=+